MSYHPYRTNGSSQPSRPDGMRSVRADLRPSRQVSGGSPGRQISGARRFPHRRQVMGSLHERQRSIGSVLDSGGVLRGVALGVVAMVAVAVRKEDRLFSLSGTAPGAASRGARWLARFGGSGSHYLPRSRGSDERLGGGDRE